MCDADPSRPEPRITVCLCTHNRPAYASDCLDGLTRQTVGSQRFSVLVVDSGSTPANRANLRTIVGFHPNARLIGVGQPGVSLARNAGAEAIGSGYVAYIDDDAIPAPDWIERIILAIQTAPRPPAVVGGRILPQWEAPLPRWWPTALRGVLSIIEIGGRGEYGSPELPPELEPYGANMTLLVPALLEIGGFGISAGRCGDTLLSDEEVQVTRRLQNAGHLALYDDRVIVHHRIQAVRLTPSWLMSRLYWQGASTVQTRRQLGRPSDVWYELPRRLVVAALCWPAALCRSESTHWIAPRWRFAYALGFIRAAFGLPPHAQS
jgi:GT2 family glycosyltransferase